MFTRARLAAATWFAVGTLFLAALGYTLLALVRG